MKMRVIMLVSLLSAGCLSSAGTHPGYIKCKGKGVVMGAGQQSVTVIGGGAGQNTFSLSLDCGEGLEFEQGPLPVK